MPASPASAFFAFRSPLLPEFDYRDTESHKAILRRAFPETAWHTAELLDRATTAPDFYLDAVSQVHLPAWSRGRIALVGDAGYCATLLSGAGASLAMEGAQLLASSLRDASGAHLPAFAHYHKTFRAEVRRRQRQATVGATMMVPATRTAIWTRNQLSKLMILPTLAARLYRPAPA